MGGDNAAPFFSPKPYIRGIGKCLWLKNPKKHAFLHFSKKKFPKKNLGNACTLLQYTREIFFSKKKAQKMY
jgi:hypothetical protein